MSKAAIVAAYIFWEPPNFRRSAASMPFACRAHGI